MKRVCIARSTASLRLAPRRPTHSVGLALRALAVLTLVGVRTASGAGFFKLAETRGVWWLKDPSGANFYSRGVDGVGPGVALDKFDPAAPAYCALRFHPSVEKWRQATLDRLKAWGFNTFGAGTDEGVRATRTMPFTLQLGLGVAAGVPWVDPSGEASRIRYREVLAKLTRYRDDPLLIGYVLDGPLGWWDETVFLRLLRQPAAKDPLKQKLLERLTAAYHGDLRQFEEDFMLEPVPRTFADLSGGFKRAAFVPGRRPMLVEEELEWLAGEYYRAATEEVRKADPNHLVFSDVYAGYYTQPVVRAAGRYVDALAVSFDSAAPQGWAAPFFFESLTRLTHKPVLVTETYFAAQENASDDQNRHGGFMTVPTQAERAAGAAKLWAGLARFPGVIGAHWYQHADQPPAAEGEDFNFGLVDLKDNAYPDLTAALTKANTAVHGTWPEGAGLVRTPQGLRVSAMPDLPIVNGQLDEWPLERAWVPDVKSAAPFERFGDVFVCWHPEGLAVAVMYMDYRARPRAADGPETDAERLTLGVGIDQEKPVLFTLKGIQEAADPDHPEAGYRAPEVIAVRGGVPFPAEGRFFVGQSQHGLIRTVELFLPAALFKREHMDPSEVLRAAASLRLRANVREMFWPRPFALLDRSSSDTWVPLVLEPLAPGAEFVPAKPAEVAMTVAPSATATGAAAQPAKPKKVLKPAPKAKKL